MQKIDLSKTDNISVTINVEDLKERLTKYLERKMKAELKEILDDYRMDVNYPEVDFPDFSERIEKLENWKQEIEQGWILPDGTKKK